MPTDKQKLAMVEDYQKSVNHLKKLGQIQLADGGLIIRATSKGIAVGKALMEFEKDNPKDNA